MKKKVFIMLTCVSLFAAGAVFATLSAKNQTAVFELFSGIEALTQTETCSVTTWDGASGKCVEKEGSNCTFDITWTDSDGKEHVLASVTCPGEWEEN